MLGGGRPARGPKWRDVAKRFTRTARNTGRYLRHVNPSRHFRFRIAVHRAKGGYLARVLNLPGCIARGSTEVEAIENARTNIRAYLCVSQALAADEATVILEISA